MVARQLCRKLRGGGKKGEREWGKGESRESNCLQPWKKKYVWFWVRRARVGWGTYFFLPSYRSRKPQPLDGE